MQSYDIKTKIFIKIIGIRSYSTKLDNDLLLLFSYSIDCKSLENYHLRIQIKNNGNLQGDIHNMKKYISITSFQDEVQMIEQSKFSQNEKTKMKRIVELFLLHHLNHMD